MTSSQTLRYRIVDVFSDRPLAGNPLCVVLDPCPPELMQPLARETNLSETTFPEVTGPNSYSMRIFTPSVELPFAGHPSIGTAWTLGPGRWQQSTSGASVTVDADAQGAVMSQPDPVLEPLDEPRLAGAVGVGGLEGAQLASAGGNRYLLAATGEDLSGAAPDHTLLSELATAWSATGICAVRRLGDSDLQVRVFVPGAGIPEDPGTGGAAGSIGMLARQAWGCHSDLVIHQGDQIGRPCRIEVHVEPGAIRVGGRVALCAEGTFLA